MGTSTRPRRVAARKTSRYSIRFVDWMASRSPWARPRDASAAAMRFARASRSAKVYSWQDHSSATAPAWFRKVGAKRSANDPIVVTVWLGEERGRRRSIEGGAREDVGRVRHAEMARADLREDTSEVRR